MCGINGIKTNPFTRYSAEEELDFLDSIFYEPRYYKELCSLAENGTSRILVGQRGLGKSMTIYRLFNDLGERGVLACLITRYDRIPINNNENYFLYKILQELTLGCLRLLLQNPSKKKLINQYQKEVLAFCVEVFYDDSVPSSLLNTAKQIKRKKRINKIKAFFNSNLKLVNGLVNCVVNITIDLIKKGTGLEQIDYTNVSRQYIGELKLEEIHSIPMEEMARWNKDKLIQLLNEILGVIKSLGFKTAVVLFDKIDEYQEISSDVKQVADFTKDILSDTDLLYINNLSIVFSLWSEVKRDLQKQHVRFDKFKDIDITWRDEELESLINKRLQFFFSSQDIVVTLETLIPNKDQRNKVLELSDGSPRSLIRLLSEIYNEEHSTKPIDSFSMNAVSRGMLEYCKRFDYDALQTARFPSRQDMVSWINKLLRLKKHYFSSTEFKSTFSLNLTTNAKWIDTLIKGGIIKVSIEGENLEEQFYEISDPRIKHLITNGIIELS